jgi:hypothetical protein
MKILSIYAAVLNQNVSRAVESTHKLLVKEDAFL